MKVHWIPTVDGEHRGFGRVALEMQAHLSQLGVEFCGLRDMDWDIRFVIGGACAWMTPGYQADMVYATCFEADPLPEGTIAVLNRCAGVWLPNEWCLDLYERNGMRRPTLVAPYAVNAKLFPYQAREEHDRPYTFLWIGDSLGDGETFGGRKGGELVIKAFAGLKLPDSRLVLKTHRGSAVNKVKVNGSAVETIAENMSHDQYVYLLGRADCLVYPSRGEGFGLIPLEAMATGLPVIATAGSGMAEFVREPMAVPIPVRGKCEAKLFAKAYGHQCWWDDIAVDDVAERMRWAYDHRSEMVEKGRKAAQWVQETYSWAESAAALEQFLAET